MKRIHIVSSGPRTGSTLLAETMVTCFDIDHFCDHEASICSTQLLDGNCFLTKNPGDINSVYLPLLFNPELYVICIIRDPRDTIVSSHGARPDIYYTGLRWWKLFVKKFDRLNTITRFIPIKYEDLVTNPDKIQEYLIERISFLKKQHKFSQYHLIASPSELSEKALKGVRPIKPKDVGKWKDHLLRVKQQISIHGSISNELIKFGYENDKEWEKLIENVNPKNFDQDRPEFLSFQDKYDNAKRELFEVINILIRKIGLEPSVVYKPFKKIINRVT